MNERLTSREIVILRSLAMRGASSTPISVPSWQIRPALPLWRRRLVDIWFRQSPDGGPSPRGPYYTLTIVGARLALEFLHPAPRGFSGAEQAR